MLRFTFISLPAQEVAQSLGDICGEMFDGTARHSPVAIALSNPYFNFRPIERKAVRDLIARVWGSQPPVIA